MFRSNPYHTGWQSMFGSVRQSWQWQQTLTVHDPNPPITLEDGPVVGLVPAVYPHAIARGKGPTGEAFTSPLTPGGAPPAAPSFPFPIDAPPFIPPFRVLSIERLSAPPTLVPDQPKPARLDVLTRLRAFFNVEIAPPPSSPEVLRLAFTSQIRQHVIMVAQGMYA